VVVAGAPNEKVAAGAADGAAAAPKEKEAPNAIIQLYLNSFIHIHASFYIYK
jgi:hypothetical protein